MDQFFQRVAAQAITVKPLKVLLTVLALPFYVLGLVLGFALVAVSFAVSAARVGMADARAKVSPEPVGVK